MRLKLLCTCAVVLFAATAALALDEAILTPTEVVQVAGVSAEESAKVQARADMAFESAMAVWNTHRYAEGTKLLRKLSAEHPNSRWKAEAELHVGCYLTYVEQYDEARSIFDRAKAAHPGTSIATKASIRLGNIAEREGKLDEALKHYAGVLRMNPTWDQFKYANYRARKLMMTQGKRQTLITCGPVALAACFEALGRPADATVARQIVPPDEGLSLAVLEAHARMYGIPARCVEMSIEDLNSSSVPVLAAVHPNHFLAITSLKDGRATVEDSIRGKREVAIADLKRAWAGRALVFGASEGLQSLTLAASLETLGGCCGQTDEDECLSDPSPPAILP